MDPYVDFTYYTTSYHGTKVSETVFPNYALIASALVNSMTFGRSDIIMAVETGMEIDQDKIRMATCAVMEQYAKLDTDSVNIQSEKVGSYAVTYFENMNATKQKQYLGAAMPFLLDTGLMYRGV